MNDRPLHSVTSLLSQPSAPEAPPADEETLCDDEDTGLDKYDISTLACTD